MPDGYVWEEGIIKPEPAQFPAGSKPPQEYQNFIEKGELDALEGYLMERFETSPGDSDFYIPAYRFLIKKKESQRAGALLQLHIDCLKAKKEIAAEIALTQAILGFWPECKPARDALVRHFRVLYADSPHFDALYAKLNIPESEGLETLRLFEAWLRYDEGRIVYMAPKGTGRVKEVNLAIGVLRVMFEGGQQMSFKIDEAQRLCASLSKEHFLSVKVTDPARLAALSESDPGGLLSFLFASVKQALSLADVRDMLRGVVPDAGWSSWWAKARKDPRLTVGTGARAEITWSDSSDAAANAIVEQFEKMPAREKPSMLHQHGNRSGELASRMIKGIVIDANTALQSDPSLALELYLELDNLPKDSVTGISFSPADLVSRPDAVDIIANVKDRTNRKKAIALAGSLRQDWPMMYGRLMRNEPDNQCLAFLYESLRDKGQAAVCEQVVLQAIGDPASMPRFYAWLCKEMPSRPELLARADAAFLLSLLRVLDSKAFRGQNAALRKLFDLGEAADRAVTVLDEQDSVRVLESLGKDNGLEDYRKDRVKAEIFHLHPQLQEKKVELIYVTHDKIEEKRQELRKLVSIDIPHNSKEIQRTREYGDLRENFEYHAARAKQEMLSSRAKTLHDELNRARTIESFAKDTSKVSIGTRITLRDQSGGEIVLTLLGPWDSDPSKNILSYTSAAGAGLLGKKQGDSVTFNDRAYAIDRIEAWSSQQ